MMRIEDLPADFMPFRHDICYLNRWLKKLPHDPSLISMFDDYRNNWRSPLCADEMHRSGTLGRWITTPDSELVKITRFLTSPAARSRLSAGLAGIGMAEYGEELVIENCALACERDFGSISSIKTEDDLFRYLESLEARRADPVGYNMFGAETMFQLYQRAENYLHFTQPRERVNSERHLLSTHSSFMWALRGVIEGLEPEKLVEMMADPAQYIGYGDALQYKRQPKGVLLRRICRIDSLPKRGEGWEDVSPLRTHFQIMSQAIRLVPTTPLPAADQ